MHLLRHLSHRVQSNCTQSTAISAHTQLRRILVRYVYNLRRFLRWLGEDAELAEITPEVLELYQASLGHLSASTIINALSTIRDFCRWAIKNKLRKDDPSLFLDFPKKARRVFRALSIEDTARSYDSVGQQRTRVPQAALDVVAESLCNIPDAVCRVPPGRNRHVEMARCRPGGSGADCAPRQRGSGSGAAYAQAAAQRIAACAERSFSATQT
jgi:hypothetical protein